MTSKRQAEANRRNSQLSSGPRDTSRTRLNALKHGIFSNQVLISDWEDGQEFERLRKGLTDALAPNGELEQLLVDDLISLTWRRRRTLSYERAAIRRQADDNIRLWKNEDIRRWAGSLPNELDSLPLETLASLVEWLEFMALVAGVANDPLESLPDIWRQAFTVAEARFAVPIAPVLGLKDRWTDEKSFSHDQVRRVISAVCEKSNINEAGFWEAVHEETRKEKSRVEMKLESRNEFATQRLLAGVPDGAALEKLLRYEGLISRTFFKTLHELQRLQAERVHGAGPPPLAIDIQG